MSVRIFEDIEEAIAREIRRISFHDSKTVDKIVLQDTYDPFTGEVISVPIEPSFFDSSADASNIQYPHFFIRLMKTREDRFSNREVSLYGKPCKVPSTTSPKAFKIIVNGADGLINAVGNELETGLFQIAKVQVGYLLRLLSGNNKGTYKISSITKSASGPHSIFVSSDIVEGLPVTLFDSDNRLVIFQESVDLNTVKVGDVYEDSLAATFNITAIDINSGTITIDGVATPDLASGSKITRTGDIFTSTDLTNVKFIVMDPAQLVTVNTYLGDQAGSSTTVATNPQVPLDGYYRIRIDSKTKENHTAIINRVWEEFNPPRTALPVVIRTALSAEQFLTVDVTSGGSSTVDVESTNDFNVGDPVVIFDDVSPTKRTDGEGFQTPFESKVKSILSATQLELEDTVPDTFTVSNCSKIVSNTEYKLHMFHFLDHVTKDVEGAQYWVHEFTFWVQFWIDRHGEESEIPNVTEVSTPMEDIDGNVIIEC